MIYVVCTDNGESWGDWSWTILSVHNSYDGAIAELEKRGFHEVEPLRGERRWEYEFAEWSTFSAWIERWEVKN